MKKLFALLLAMAMVLTLAACGQQPEPTTPTTKPTTKPTTAPTTEPATEPTTAPTEGGSGEGGEEEPTLPEKPTGEGVAAGTQIAVVVGEEWGPAVSKTIVTLDQTVAAGSVTADSFVVYEVKETIDFGVSSGEEPSEEPATVMAVRVVTDAYTCDAEGNKVDTDSNMIAIEMSHNYDAAAMSGEGSPFLYDFMTGFNHICTPYELHLYTSETAALINAEGTAITGLNVGPAIDFTAAQYPEATGVDISGLFIASDGTELHYASYAPAEDDKQNALVIWLHGAGEGGDNPIITIYGNEGTALFSEEFQSCFDGAYVLCPQSPTMWMNDGSGEYTSDGASMYTASLFELIDTYVQSNPDIDPNRIVIGGCSNGGYMTMNMIMTHPDYFAAAYPICEAYTDSWITDDMLNSIADLPIWFVHALNDTTVDPTLHTIATYGRLSAINDNVHFSEFADVGVYMGHWSWIYFFNNECEVDGLNMWQWLSEQSK